MRNITLSRVRVKSSAPVSPLSLRPSPAVVRCFNINHSSVQRKPRGPVTASARCQREAKSRSRARLADLPQGSIALEPLPRDEDKPTYPTVVQQARSNMTKFENCVLLTRVGSFYELYFKHAEEFGPLLNLKVAQKKTNAGAVAMAGFPVYQLDRFLKILVLDLNRYVAISEEFLNNTPTRVKSGGLMFDRKVTRIITPGTLIDENFMDPYENNFLLGIHLENRALVRIKESRQSLSADETSRVPIGLAWLDLSTGDFFTQSTTLASLPSSIARIRPREIVLDENLQVSYNHDIPLMLQEDRYLITYHPTPSEVLPVSAWSSMLEVPVSEKLQVDFTTEEVAAGSSLLDYVRVRLLGMKMKLQSPIRRLAVENMGVDKNSMRALEIKSTLRDGVTKGSLFHAVRRTVTKSGARLLGNWLSRLIPVSLCPWFGNNGFCTQVCAYTNTGKLEASPSTSLSTINTRLDLVSQFVDNQELRASIVQLLHRSHDTQRLVQKFSLGRGDPEDLIALSRTIEATQGIFTILGDILKCGGATPTSNGLNQPHLEPFPGIACITELLRRLSLDGPTELANRISKTIDEECLMRKQRIEEREAADIRTTAREIADTGTDEDGKLTILKKCASNGESGSNSGGDLGFEDVWVMRKRYKS
ncbi:MAG: DNA mismatch repair ATPase msh1 [Geoglossum umbratile]|nr:MAG: DNA mismatch repair ATPase msh1 [Geoglossum umbratile]